MATSPIPVPVNLNPSAPIVKIDANAAAPTALTVASPDISGAASSVAVTVPNTSGTVTFQLVVTDNLGVKSAPATVTVTIQGAPIARLTAAPMTVAPNGTITLSGAGSTSSGTLSNYEFTMQPPVITLPINPIRLTNVPDATNPTT